MTRSRRHTLSACLKQSILLIFPFWSGFDRMQDMLFFPVIPYTKSSRHSCVMSFLSFPSKREAHFCFTSIFSFCHWKGGGKGEQAVLVRSSGTVGLWQKEGVRVADDSQASLSSIMSISR